ncbi:MAG: flagellar export chaperone FliS [Paraclostridium sp.]
MYQANPYNTYKQNSINMASGNQLLLMLVDGAVKYTKVAKMAIEEKNMARAHKELIRVQDIFTELMITLDKGAGKWAQDLYKVYDFIRYELGRANIRKDVSIINKTLPLIQEVRDTWYEADKLSKQGR